MEKCSKKELISVVNSQNEQIKRYETRLRDVVVAYKGLVKEKEALEASVKALSGPHAAQPSEASHNSKHEGKDKTRSGPKATSPSKAEMEGEEDKVPRQEETVEQLQQQLTTLTNSLATLSAEKSRMEASFQADKKQLRHDKEEQDKRTKDLQEKLHQGNTELESLKGKLTAERQERDKEQSNHGVMIRELQKLLSEERCQKERAELLAEELHTKLGRLEQQSGQYEKRLRDELETTRRRLKRVEAEAKSKETPPLLLELQDEMAGLKRQHQAAILQEQRRAADAEERARKLAATHEERVANLEGRLAELSETVGNYDRLRQQDQAAIMKLKEHIAQLDTEHSSFDNSLPEPKETDEADVQALVKQILLLRCQLVAANQKADKPVDVHTVLCGGECCKDVDQNDHEACRLKLEQLQHELEWYKKQKVQQPKSFRNDDTDTMSLVNTLKERIRLLNTQMTEKEEHKRKVDVLQKLLKAERAHSKSELSACEGDYRSRIALLEQQLVKQRERTLKLLDDKEQEIRMLKSAFGTLLPGNNIAQQQNMEAVPTSTGTEDVLSHLSQFSLSPSGGGESPHMLHYAHELARRDVEISSLRKTNHKLEGSARELRRALTTDREQHGECLQQLTEEIARLERCKSRESANLEYLKNVVLSFLLSSDPNCKRHMVNAIATILKFSSSELDRINAATNS